VRAPRSSSRACLKNEWGFRGFQPCRIFSSLPRHDPVARFGGLDFETARRHALRQHADDPRCSVGARCPNSNLNDHVHRVPAHNACDFGLFGAAANERRRSMPGGGRRPERLARALARRGRQRAAQESGAASCRWDPRPRPGRVALIGPGARTPAVADSAAAAPGVAAALHDSARSRRFHPPASANPREDQRRRTAWAPSTSVRKPAAARLDRGSAENGQRAAGPLANYTNTSWSGEARRSRGQRALGRTWDPSGRQAPAPRQSAPRRAGPIRWNGDLHRARRRADYTFHLNQPRPAARPVHRPASR